MRVIIASGMARRLRSRVKHLDMAGWGACAIDSTSTTVWHCVFERMCSESDQGYVVVFNLVWQTGLVWSQAA